MLLDISHVIHRSLDSELGRSVPQFERLLKARDPVKYLALVWRHCLISSCESNIAPVKFQATFVLKLLDLTAAHEDTIVI